MGNGNLIRIKTSSTAQIMIQYDNLVVVFVQDGWNHLIALNLLEIKAKVVRGQGNHLHIFSRIGVWRL